MSTQALETIKSQPVAMVTERIVTKNGKEVGERVKFSGRTAREVKEMVKATGKTGDAARKEVNSLLNGTKDFAVGVGQLFVTAMIQKGYIPDVGEERKNSAVLKFVKPAVEKAKTVEEQVESMTDAERAALFDKLLAKMNKAEASQDAQKAA